MLVQRVTPPQGKDVALPFELHDWEMIIFCIKLCINTKTTGVQLFALFDLKNTDKVT